jgi:hypothetical protein
MKSAGIKVGTARDVESDSLAKGAVRRIKVPE